VFQEIFVLRAALVLENGELVSFDSPIGKTINLNERKHLKPMK